MISSRKRTNFVSFTTSSVLGIIACLILLTLITECLPPPRVVMVSQINNFEGYARIRVNDSHRILKSKISFLFSPDKGRIDVLGVLGNSMFQILISQEKAYLLVPRSKVYWSGLTEEILEKSIGFELNISEITALLTGRWTSQSLMEGNSVLEKKKWHLIKDKQQRIIQGRRNGLLFRVEEFFRDSPLPRKIEFFSETGHGKIKILNINFNQPVKANVFSLSFLKNYQQKTWEEIAKILENES
ncbi:MAG: DUF4292 domain-containing protein [Candidatus Aminicenantia bacterium]